MCDVAYKRLALHQASLNRIELSQMPLSSLFELRELSVKLRFIKFTREPDFPLAEKDIAFPGTAGQDQAVVPMGS